MKIKLYDSYEEVSFVHRLNRFVMEVEKNKEIIKIYVPNTGKMEEYLMPGTKFFIVPYSGGKYQYRLVSVKYKDQFVLLDTNKVNDIFEMLLKKNLLKEFVNCDKIFREVTYENSRFDFVVMKENIENVIEVKSCTLVHKKIALFPDAPTERGRKHIIELDALAKDANRQCYNFYLTTNYSAEIFFPNFHTDPAYASSFTEAENVNFRAIKLRMTSPIEIDLASLKYLQIDKNTVELNNINKGSYCLILHNENDFELEIGKIGKRYFPIGYYVYVGSAMNSLDSRIKRHKKIRKNKHWHIDYISGEKMQIMRVIPFRNKEKIESDLAKDIIKIADDYIDDFGATDDTLQSHLFYFSNNPLQNKDFYDIILDYRTFQNKK